METGKGLDYLFCLLLSAHTDKLQMTALAGLFSVKMLILLWGKARTVVLG